MNNHDRIADALERIADAMERLSPPVETQDIDDGGGNGAGDGGPG